MTASPEFASVSGFTSYQLRSRTGLHVPNYSSRVPDEVKNNCQFILTGVPNTNGKVFRVYCPCMAQVKVHNPTRYFNYDFLIETDNIGRAITAWKIHKGTV